MLGRGFPSQKLIIILGLALTGSLMGVENQASVDELLQKLRNDQFAVRRQAQEQLIEWGKKDPAGRIDFFWEQRQNAKDPEVRERCLTVLKELVLMELDRAGPGFIGIEMAPVPVPPVEIEGELLQGVVVSGVMPETPAEKFGIKPGDLILKIDEVGLSGIRGSEVLKSYVSGKEPGAEIKVKLLRNGEIKEFPLTLMRRPRSADLRMRNPFGRDLGSLPSEEELRQRDFERWLREKENAERGGR